MSVELPEPVTTVALSPQSVLFVERVTMPVKPFTAVIAMVDEPAALTFTLILVGLAVIVKSWTTNVTITEWESRPLVPVISTRLLPVDVKVQERVELPAPVTLAGERLQDDVVFVARLTTPANWFTAPTVIVDVPAVLTIRLALDGLAAIVKS